MWATSCSDILIKDGQGLKKRLRVFVTFHDDQYCQDYEASFPRINFIKTSQELRMLSSVTINCQERMIV